MIKSLFAGASVALCIGAAAFAQTSMSPTMASDPSAPMTTPQFLKAAAQSDEFEIREGKMAQTMSQDPAVQKFGAKMVRDHTMSTDDMHAAIRRAGMSVPPAPPLRPDQQQMVAQLQGLSGPAFNRAYLSQQIDAHKSALAAMTNYGENGDVPAIKMAAQKTVPMVRSHLQIATRMQAKMSSM